MERHGIKTMPSKTPQLLACLALILVLALPSKAAAGGPGCYADSACRLYGDCCDPVPDRRSAMAPGLSCGHVDSLGVELPPAPGTSGPADFAQLLQTCPISGHPDVDRCQSNQGRPRSLFDPLLLPAMTQDGLLFRSGYCARCNGRKQLLRPEVSVRCEPGLLAGGRNHSVEQLSRYFMKELKSGRNLPDSCLVATRFRGHRVHQCVFSVIDHCLNSSATEAQRSQCEDGGVSLTTEPCGTFRNPACLDCHGPCLSSPWGLDPFGIPSGGSILSNVVNFWIPLDQAVKGGSDLWLDPIDGNVSDPNSSNASSMVSDDDEEAMVSTGPQQVMLIVTYSVSILSLILLLIVYTLLPHLRNRAGQLLMSHSASVMVLQTVQLFSLCAGGQNLLGSGCVAVHFVFYFFLVSAFVWAFLFGWDLLRTFASLLRNSAFKPSRYGRFALIGWGLPLVLTAVLVGLHLGIGLLDVSNGCRYRPDRVAVMVALSFAPLLVAIVFNAAIVCLLAVQLLRTYRETRTAGQSSASKLCIMTVKVSVIMGAAWLPYFVIMLADRGRNPGSAGFAGELLCSLHGLFLAIGFTGNRRVRARLSEMTSSVLKRRSSGPEAVGTCRTRACRRKDVRSMEIRSEDIRSDDSQSKDARAQVPLMCQETEPVA